MHNETHKQNIDAVVAGLTCLDITPLFMNKKIDHIEELLIPSKTVMVDKPDIHPGGCVSNTGLALCKFGINCRLMGKVGDDEFGNLIIRIFEEYTSVDNMIVSKKEGTSYSLVLAPKGIDRIFIHYPGANDTFSCNDIDFEVIKKARLFHFGYPTAMEKMGGNNGEELLELFRRVKELGVTTSLDVCGIDEDSPLGKENWGEILKKTIPYVDIFLPSIEELSFMMSPSKYKEWEERAGGKELTSVIEEKDIEPFAERLLEWGAKIIMIKCGSKGIYFATGKKELLKKTGIELSTVLGDWNDIKYFEKSFKPNKVISATGAGDTCIAAFLASVLKGYSWEKCLQYAAATGASCVEAVDALGGILSFEEMDDKISRGWERNL